MLELYMKGGVLMHPILLASVIALTITLERSWYFLRSHPKNLRRQFERIERSLQRKDRKEAIRIAAAIPGPLGRVFQVGLGCGKEDHEIVAERMAICGEELAREAAKGLSLLALIPSVSTMLGLLGTVLGLVLAFQKVSQVTGNVSPILLASGIWVALITTVAGMFVAIPSLIAHHTLQTQLANLSFEIEHFGSRLLLLLKKHSSFSEEELRESPGSLELVQGPLPRRKP